MSENEDINNYASTLSKVQIQMIVDTLINNYLGELLVKLTDEQISRVLDSLGWENLKSSHGRIKESWYFSEKTLLFGYSAHESILDRLTYQQRKSLLSNLNWAEIIILVSYTVTLEKTAKFADAIRSEQIRIWLSTLTERQLWRLAANMEKQKINSFVQTLTHEQLGRFMLNITAEQMLWVVWYLDNEQLDRVPII